MRKIKYVGREVGGGTELRTHNGFYYLIESIHYERGVVVRWCVVREASVITAANLIAAESDKHWTDRDYLINPCDFDHHNAAARYQGEINFHLINRPLSLHSLRLLTVSLCSKSDFEPCMHRQPHIHTRNQIRGTYD